MKKLVVSVFLFLIAAASFAQKNTGRMIIPEANLEFERNSDKTSVTITGFKYSSYSENKKFDGRMIEIPSKIQGLPVTAIGLGEYGYMGAFQDKGYNISGLWIPDSVKTIGVSSSENGVFNNSSFGSIRLPDGLKTITNRTFVYCSAKSINIPSSVTRIGGGAFYCCSIESVTIPKGCTIVGSDSFGFACFGRSGLKTINFPAGRVYFEASPLRVYYGETQGGIFTDCNSLTNISIPKGFEAVYRSESDFKDHTLADYISGEKLSKNFAAQDILESVKVRNVAVVDHEAYLAAYNQAIKSGDYARAMLLAKQYKEYYPYYKSSEWTVKYNEAVEKPYLDAYNKAFASKDYAKAMQTAKEFKEKNQYINSSDWTKRYEDAIEKPYLDEYNKTLASKDYTKAIQLAKEFKEKNPSIRASEWTKRYTDIAEKTYLDDYNKAAASKDWQKAKKIINEFRGKISSDSSLKSLESKWDDMLFDVDCKMYLPAYVEKLEKKGSVAKVNSNLQFKIPLTKDLYENSKFNFTDSEGNGLWTVSYTLFLRKIKEFTGKDYQIYDNYSNSYLYRDATAEESSAYYQVRKDAVKQFMESAVNASVIENDGSNSLLKIYLAKDTYSYSNYTFTVKDASGTAYTLSDKDFLAYAKEVCGTEYKLNGYYSGSYLYRNATSEEITTYNQVRKDAVKYFMEEATKNGTVEKDNSNLLFKIYLSDSTYSYSNSKFTVKDASGDAYTLSDKDFLSYAKEVFGTEYNLYGNYSGSYLYRNATSEEIAAYHQPRKYALKPFLDDVVKSLKFEEKGSNLMVKIYLPYLVGDSVDSFYLKDSSGKEYTVDSTFFLSYVKEIYGVSYNLYRNGNNGSYLYRNATDEEISAYQQPRKDAVKQFMDRALNVAVIEKDGSNFLFKIYLADDTYNSSNGLFGIIDSSGNEYILSNKDFLAYAKEVCGTEYKLQEYYYGSYLYRNATTEEVEAYYQVRKDAVKQFMERAVNVGVIEKDGSNLLFKIYLSESTYSYSNSKFTVKDSSGTAYTLSDKDFLSYAKEVCGMEYKLNGSYYSNSSYLYRNATEAELAAYHQVRKDAVKYFMEEAVKKGTVEKDSSNLLFKIYLSDSTYSYSNSKFTVKDSSGTAYTLSDKDFLSYAKEVCGTEYNLYYKYNGSYLYRNATEEETDTFYKSRKEAIKIFMDNAVKNGTIKKDGSNLIFKFYLSDSIFDYHNGIFTVKDSKGKTYTLAKDDFLSSVKESCGIEYDMYWTHFSDYSFLFRNATAEEAAAYHQPKIDALKPFLDDVMKGAKFEKQGSNLLFKIYLPYLSYNYNSGSYSFKDSSGKTYTVDGTYFLSYVKEICGASYELSVNGNTNSYLYRNATDEEISAYQQPRKDAVKQFMDRALNVAVIEKDGSNSLLKIYLADDTYSYGNDSFYMVDSSGNKYTMSDKDFLAYAKEVCGTEYKLHGYYSGSYLYRNATTEEIKAYYQVRKDAVKQFMERAVNVGVIEKDGSNLLFKIYLSESTYNYRNSKFTIKDSSGNAYTLSNDDFLSYAKETSGIDYKLYGNYNGSYLYAKANDMLQLKCVFAFQNGNLHTNLVYKLKDKWEFPVEFAESNGTVTIKSFKVKKSVFEENGLKTKDVVKKIVVSDADGKETEIDWKDLPNVQAPSTLLITVVRGSGKKAQTYIFKVPVEWDVNEMKSVKDILDFKCILAFKNGTLHTNLACNVDGKWMYVAEFVESKGEVIIKSFRTKKSVLERVGLKTKDIIKKVVLIDDSENEIAVVNNLFEIQAPATLRFTIERGSGKKAQTMIFDVPVEWNEDEVKNLR